MEIETKSLEYLINIIKTTKASSPNYVLFTGAGSSISSGVKGASEIIEEWRKKYFEINRKEHTTFDDFYKDKYWYKTETEYSFLFENLFDHPSQRREYIESIIKDAKPSWGYIYLVNLIKHEIFNTIFTTNFDDLLNEACYLYTSDIRPIVCSHESTIRTIKMTSKRPKIIKLHGDFLYDNIKNTVRELETLEDNIKDKIKQYASEFGMIVVGYTGRDRSIMDTLNILLKQDEYFPHGIYWCIRKGEEPCRGLEILLRYPKVKIIEIDGFDEMFAEINKSLDLNLQDEILKPYDALNEKLNKLLESVNIKIEDNINPIIKEDINKLKNNIDSIVNKIDNENNEDNSIKVSIDENFELKIPMPFNLLSQIALKNNDYENSIKYAQQGLKKEFDISLINNIFKSNYYLKNDMDYNNYIEIILNNKDTFIKEPDSLFTTVLLLIDLKKFKEADKILDMSFHLYNEFKGTFNIEYYFLNKFQIKKHQKIEFSEEEILILENYSLHSDKFVKLGSYILLNNIDEVQKLLNIILIKDKNLNILTWPIVKLIISEIRDNKLNEVINNYNKLFN